MANVQMGKLTFSEDSVRRYAEKIINQLRGMIHPDDKESQSKYWRIRDAFKSTGIVTNSELCTLQIIRSKYVR